MAPLKWYQAALLGGGAAAGISLLLYYIVKSEEKNAAGNQETDAGASENASANKLDIFKATKDQTLQILQRVLQSQEKMKLLIRILTKDLINTELDFDSVYYRVVHMIPEDPLEETGLSMMDFDQLLGKYENDATIKDIISKIMIPPLPADIPSNVSNLSQAKITEIHQFMAQELKKLSNHFHSRPNYKNYEVKSVTIVVQVISAVLVERKYAINMEELEIAVLLHHIDLATDAEFAAATCEMQAIMSEFIG